MGIGRNGVEPFTCGKSIDWTVPPAVVTFVLRVYSELKLSQEKSIRMLVPASARPAGLYQMAPRSSAPATNAPPRPSGRTPRSAV